MTLEPRGFTGRLAGLAARNPWKIVAIWALIFIMAGGISAAFPADMTTDANFTNDPESKRGDDLLLERMTGSPSPDELVIVKSSGATVDSPEFQTFVEELQAELIAVPDQFVSQIVSYYDTNDPSLVSDDQQAMIIPVFLSDPDASAASYVETIEELDGVDGFTVATGGEPSINFAFEETSESDLLTGETIGISVALIVLVIVFGTLVSAGIPLGLAITSIAIAIGVTMILGHAFSLSIFVTNMIVMIGLAVGIDYALFIVGRYREERKNGLEIPDAIVRAGDTASKAVLFSGMTVVIALFGMLIVPSTIFNSLGTGAIIVVIVAVAATMTLLPAVIKLLGNKINRGTGRVLTGTLGVVLLLFAALFQFGLGVNPAFAIIYVVLALVSFAATIFNIPIIRMRDSTEKGGFWDRISGFVMRHPGVLVTVTTIALVAIGLIYFTIEPGAVRHYDAAGRHIRATSLRATWLRVQRHLAGRAARRHHRRQRCELAGSPDRHSGVCRLDANDPAFGPTVVRTNDAGDLATISLPAVSDVQSSEELEAVKRLRNDYVPQAFGDINADVLVDWPKRIYC